MSFIRHHTSSFLLPKHNSKALLLIALFLFANIATTTKFGGGPFLNVLFTYGHCPNHSRYWRIKWYGGMAAPCAACGLFIALVMQIPAVNAMAQTAQAKRAPWSTFFTLFLLISAFYGPLAEQPYLSLFGCSVVWLSRYGNTRPNLTSSCPTPPNPYIF